MIKRISSSLLFFFLFFSAIKAPAQDYSFLQQEIVKPSIGFHSANRDSLRKILPKNSVAVFFSAPIRNKSNDIDYEYHQNPDFYYLSGFNEPNAALLVFKNTAILGDDSIKEVLFVQKKDPDFELWNGERLGVEEAKQKLGIEKVLPVDSLLPVMKSLPWFERVFYSEPTGMTKADSAKTDKLFGIYHIVSSNLQVRERNSEAYLELMMAKLRQIKTAEEIEILRKAINITSMAQIELMKSLKPEMYEYETEAIVEYIFHRAGAQFPGFPSIHGGGANSCVLHYVKNRSKLEKGDLLVSDIGAELHGYSADVTRTLPVSGKFSNEQRLIYELVLKAQKAGIEAAQPGNSFYAPHTAAKKIIAEGLKELGIIKDLEQVSRYFMHGTSHYLGLDVHDVGLYQELEEGNVITVEPGIYIKEGSNCDPKWWNIGVRIEDDILIRAEGPENLSEMTPREVDEIEKLMKEAGSFEHVKFLETK